MRSVIYNPKVNDVIEFTRKEPGWVSLYRYTVLMQYGNRIFYESARVGRWMMWVYNHSETNGKISAVPEPIRDNMKCGWCSVLDWRYIIQPLTREENFIERPYGYTSQSLNISKEGADSEINIKPRYLDGKFY